MSDDTRGYHHGDLRAALLEAGIALVREGGTAALGLREVTRSVGVTPSAAYRHFTDLRALVLSVAGRVQAELADTMRARMEKEMTATDPGERAVQRLRGVGLGYIDFAISEPGWFELAIGTHDDGADAPVTVGGAVPPPFATLMDALDNLVEADVITRQRREHAEWPCWSSVHGFADIATRGPLKTQPRPMLDALAAVVVDTIIKGVLDGQD